MWRAATECRLFSIPPEVRNHIYELALQVPTMDGHVSLVRFSRSKYHSVGRVRPLSVLTLLQTCRQICCEAQGIFYDIHHLRFGEHPAGTRTLLPFLGVTSTKRLEAIRKLTFITPDPDDTAILLGMMRKLLPGLRVLQLIPSPHTAKDLGDDAKRELFQFEGLEDFRILEPPGEQEIGFSMIFSHPFYEQETRQLRKTERAVRKRLKMARLRNKFETVTIDEFFGLAASNDQ